MYLACFYFPSLILYKCMRIYTCVYGVYTHICVCLCVYVYNCLGSQRVTEPEFDEGTAVMSKGGWGLFLSTTFSVYHKVYFYLWCCYEGCLAGTQACISEQQGLGFCHF